MVEFVARCLSEEGDDSDDDDQCCQGPKFQLQNTKGGQNNCYLQLPMLFTTRPHPLYFFKK
jgi:hypothetical protein